ncbi:MAG: flagellar biosynthesis protein FlhB [Planctomycetes bacterium]|nr:flagellar biosynthesis protein FlhB [Planctomycetota bacterium]
MPWEAEDRTEAPTPRRRREARMKGQVARSHDLPAAILLFVGMWVLGWAGPRIWQSLLAVVRTALTAEAPASLEGLRTLSAAIAVEAGRQLAPLVGILLLTVLIVLYAQVGALVTWQPLIPSLSKINPLGGLQRLFSLRSVVLSVFNCGKLVVVGSVAYLTISGRTSEIAYALSLGFQDVVRLGASLVYDLGLRLAAVLMVLAILDFIWQRYRYEQDLRMTKEEVKEELRSMEGDPKLKARRRQVQFQLAVQRLKRHVPKADVVVTNPTHLAVAIRYDAEVMNAPQVTAKGADYMALRIRQIAAEYGVPVVERKPLARALYESVEVGQYIPEKFYRAVAEILAYVYELTGRAPAAVRRQSA